MSKKVHKTIEQDESESQEMKASQGFRQAFIVTRQAAKAAQPAEAAFNYPATREQDKATFGIRQLDTSSWMSCCAVSCTGWSPV